MRLVTALSVVLLAASPAPLASALGATQTTALVPDTSRPTHFAGVAAPARLVRLTLVAEPYWANRKDTLWREADSFHVDDRAAVRLLIYGSFDSVSAFARRLRLEVYTGRTRRAREIPYPFPSVACLGGDCAPQGTFVAISLLGNLPQADTVTIRLRGDGDSLLASHTVSVQPLTFRLGASVGTAIPLNGTGGQGIAPRIGLNGRLQIADLRGQDPCHPRGESLVFAPLCPVLRVTRILAPSATFLSGPFLLEGDFALAVAGQDSIVPADSTRLADTTLTFQQVGEGHVRIEVPLLSFGDPLSLRGFWQGGFVVTRGRPEYWEQRYVGFRLGIDGVDVSGRQSFVEIAWGTSENLEPPTHRMRSTIQLRVPRTDLVFQFTVNRGRHPTGGTSPVVLSIFSPLDFRDIQRKILGTP